MMPSRNTYHLTWVSLTLDVGHLFMADPAKCRRCSLPWMSRTSLWVYSGLRNRFKGLDLIDRVPDELWTEVHDIVVGDREQDHPHGKEMHKSHMAVWGGLTNSCEKKRGAKSKGEKERYNHLNAEFKRIARRDKKAFLSNQCKEIEENNRMGKTRDLFKKIWDTKGTFHAKMGLIKTEMVWA